MMLQQSKDVPRQNHIHRTYYHFNQLKTLNTLTEQKRIISIKVNYPCDNWAYLSEKSVGCIFGAMPASHLPL